MRLIRFFALFGLCFVVVSSVVLPLAIHAQDSAPFRVYLAFEDGPTDAYTPEILDILAQYNARASFVVSGAQINGREHLLQRELREGHALINHLWEEPGVYAGAPADAVIASYERTESALRAALGDMLPLYDAQPKMFWQPGGAAQPFPAHESIRVITYNWHVNSDDCGWGMPETVNLDTLAFDEGVIENILGTPVSVGAFYTPYNVFDYGDGVIVIFHDLNRVTARVLPTILTALQAAGARFEPLPRPWDVVGTMPIVLGTPPSNQLGVEGYTIPSQVRTLARVRAMPGLEGAILTTLEGGVSLTAIGRASDWIQVTSSDTTGWIHRSLLDLRGPIPHLPSRIVGD